ncbi:glutathione peroxidase [Methylobacterium indicum]|uniref:Glutathione peroxidase n=1 Tax=Methylobacterium indicum TaxID=1775910 RepID=A0A0J6RM52_9HYPH|nr:glutathione peroxidase [Methylobacterium indicum]KMO22374.1 glutathione peroxidase [Methylobacterium indicum]KMO25910.1 glutathione peroxidase [Methylobacterium indicum]KTS32160.1 glutathione peroxidase [Methylobacterium indicum]KTS37906.1 glutathione peroxidase [Methylobacterium indicum]KTS52309.1 glutathione peroxidase [Methylobacterium indicum]
MPLARREALALIGSALALPARAAAPQSAVTASAFSFAKPEGGRLALADLSAKPILIVNTATACGYAPQFAGLQQLWTRFGPRGLTVIAVPSADFGRQEPLDGMAIAEAARKNHGVTFPVVGKTGVTGPQAHPFYRWAAAEKPAETPRWNFHKYLVGRDGHLAAAFATPVEPTDTRVIAAIVKELDAAG